MTITEDAKLRRATNALRALLEGVAEYDGCDEGKRDFLRNCGLPADGGNSTPTVLVTVALRVNADHVRGEWSGDVAEAVQDALDSSDVCAGSSAYVKGVEHRGTEDPGTIERVNRGSDYLPGGDFVDDVMKAVLGD